MKYKIFDDYSIRHALPSTKNTVLIRCLSPSYANKKIPYTIKNLNKYKDVLELYFADVGPEYINKQHINPNFKCFNILMCNEICDFLDKNNLIEEIHVHCTAGISRSSAVMYNCLKYLNYTDIANEKIINNNRYYPNKLVMITFEEYFKNK